MIERADKDLGRCNIGGNGDVMYIAKTEKIALNLAVIRIGRGIAEEEQKIDLVIRNAGSYLLCAAVFAEKKSLDLKSGSIGYVFAGAARSAKGVAAERAAIGNAELRHQFFFLIVSNNSYFHLNILARELPLGAISFPEWVGFLKYVFIFYFNFTELYRPPKFSNKGTLCPSSLLAMLSNAAFTSLLGMVSTSDPLSCSSASSFDAGITPIS